METLTPVQEQLGLWIHRIGAFKDKRDSPDGRGFRLKLHEKDPEAPLSPFYFNLRTNYNPKPGPLTPPILREIGKQFYNLASSLKLEYSAVAGVPRAGDPLAWAFIGAAAVEHPARLLFLEKQEKDGSREVARVRGNSAKRGEVVLLIDDLITRAESKLEAITVLEASGFKVHDVLVLLDREQGGADELRRAGYALHALFGFSELLDLYFREGRLDRGTYDEIKSYLAAQ